MNITKLIQPNGAVIIGHTVDTAAGTFWRSTLQPAGQYGDGSTTPDYSKIETAKANEAFGTTLGEDAEAWAKKQQR